MVMSKKMCRKDRKTIKYNFPDQVNTIYQDILKYENNEIMNITAQE